MLRSQSKLKQNWNFPRCSDDIISEALIDFPGKVCTSPGKYIGLPLHTRKLRRVDVQPLLDKIGGRLPEWEGKMLPRQVGRPWSNVF
jgi:hypothetical protein